MLPEVILHPLKNGGVHSTNREDASSVGQTCTSKEKYFFKFFMIMTKKGSFIPKVCFSSPGQAMKMVDTCDVPNIMERDYECRRSFLHSFPWFREQMTGYPCQLFFWCGHSGIFCPKFGAVGFRYCTGWKGIHSAGERYIRSEFTVRDPKASNMRLVRSPGMYFLHTRKQNGWRMSVVRKRKEKSFDKARPIASHSSAWVRKIAAILTEHRVKVRLRPNANGVFWESDGRDWHQIVLCLRRAGSSNRSQSCCWRGALQ